MKYAKDRRPTRLTAGKLGALILTLLVFSLALAGNPTPLKGGGSGTVIGVDPHATYVELTIEGSGEGTHLGHFTRLEVLQIDGTGGVSGSITFTAANGDTLTVAVAGQFISATTVVGTYSITGGTGRFVGATGSADFVAVSADGIHLDFEFDGLIS